MVAEHERAGAAAREVLHLVIDAERRFAKHGRDAARELEVGAKRRHLARDAGGAQHVAPVLPAGGGGELLGGDGADAAVCRDRAVLLPFGLVRRGHGVADGGEAAGVDQTRLEVAREACRRGLVGERGSNVPRRGEGGERHAAEGCGRDVEAAVGQQGEREAVGQRQLDVFGAAALPWPAPQQPGSSGGWVRVGGSPS